MPTWLNGSSVVIMRTHNGFALAPAADARVTECLAFETWEALAYFLAANFAVQPQGVTAA